MGRINIGRLILGGIVAGIVSDALGYLVDGIWLAPQWADGLRALGHDEFASDQLIWFNVLGLVTGIVLVWVYVAIRPRFGAGVLTAIYAGVAVWVLTSLLPNLGLMWVGELFSRHLTAFTTAAALGELVIAAIAGAALYKEDDSELDEFESESDLLEP
ncbi:MAG: hypothetical protein ABR956_13095 [Terracidiphilus sp.]